MYCVKGLTFKCGNIDPVPAHMAMRVRASFLPYISEGRFFGFFLGGVRPLLRDGQFAGMAYSRCGLTNELYRGAKIAFVW